MSTATEVKNILESIFSTGSKSELSILVSKIPKVIEFYNSKFGVYNEAMLRLEPCNDCSDEIILLYDFLDNFLKIKSNSVEKNKYISSFQKKLNKTHLFILRHILVRTAMGINISNKLLKKTTFNTITDIDDLVINDGDEFYVQEKKDGKKIFIAIDDNSNIIVYSKIWNVTDITKIILSQVKKLSKVILPIFKNGCILEGEIYGNDRAKTNGILNKKTRSKEEESLIYLDLWDIYPLNVFTVYSTNKDLPDESIYIDTKQNVKYDVPYSDRYKFLQLIFSKNIAVLTHVALIENHILNTTNDIKKLFDKITKAGGEGLMLKYPKQSLILGTSKDNKTIKLKLDFDVTVQLVAVQRGLTDITKKYVNMLKYESSDGKFKFTVSNIKNEDKVEWNDSYDVTFKNCMKKFSKAKIKFTSASYNNDGYYVASNSRIVTNYVDDDDPIDNSDKILDLYKEVTGKDLRLLVTTKKPVPIKKQNTIKNTIVSDELE